MNEKKNHKFGHCLKSLTFIMHCLMNHRKKSLHSLLNSLSLQKPLTVDENCRTSKKWQLLNNSVFPIFTWGQDSRDCVFLSGNITSAQMTWEKTCNQEQQCKMATSVGTRHFCQDKSKLRPPHGGEWLTYIAGKTCGEPTYMYIYTNS